MSRSYSIVEGGPCGTCGQRFPVRADRARRQRYCSNGCASAQRVGALNNRYNGGLCRRKDGRWLICCRDGSSILFSRGVMAAELRRLLTPQEIVHHINADVNDDRPENLQIVTRAEHMNMHRADLQAGKVRHAA